jgi:hypothetical protein
MNPIAMHDQALAYIQGDALQTVLVEGLSFEVLAHQFEGYWRQRIVRELDFLETPTGISPDYYAGCKDTKLNAKVLVLGGLPNGLI